MCVYSVGIERITFIWYDVSARTNSVNRMVIFEAVTMLASAAVNLNSKRTMLEPVIKSVTAPSSTYRNVTRVVAHYANVVLVTFEDSKTSSTVTTLINGVFVYTNSIAKEETAFSVGFNMLTGNNISSC